MGYYKDDGTELNPDDFPLPNLCISCRKNGNPHELVLCNLNRMGQPEEGEFKCFSYVAVTSEN